MRNSSVCYLWNFIFFDIQIFSGGFKKMNKQKELSDLLYTVYCSDAADGGNEFDEMAKAIIAKYPCILGEKTNENA